MPSRHSLSPRPEEAGQRLDRWLARHFPALSRARLQALIASGHVLVDGVSGRASRRVRVGQAVEIAFPAPEPAEPRPEALPLRVVHEDDRLIVIDKPAGLVVHPGAGHASGTLVNALLHHAKGLSGIGGVLRPGIVHRLDRGTSGLMVVAKDDETHRALARQFAGRSVEKTYLALVLGVPARAEGEVDRPLARHPVERQRMAIRAGGREARTSWRRLEVLDGAALLSVRIHTGRTHQIRVHLASIGHPVAGDASYGGTRTPGSRKAASREALRSLARPALHAAALGFDHPEGGGRVRFESPLPEDIASVLERLRDAHHKDTKGTKK